MKSRTSFAFSALVATTLSILAVSPYFAQAAAITDIDGGVNLTLTGDGAGSATLTYDFGTGHTSQLNGTSQTLAQFIPVSFDPMQITFDAATPSIDLHVNKIIGPGGNDVTDGNAAVTGSATYILRLSEIEFPSADTLTIRGNEVLIQGTNTSSLDLDPSFLQGLFVLTFQKSNTDIQQELLDGNTVTGAASFSQNNEIRDDLPLPIPPPVPEPTSLAIWGLISLAGAGYATRRRRRQRASQV